MARRTSFSRSLASSTGPRRERGYAFLFVLLGAIGFVAVLFVGSRSGQIQVQRQRDAMTEEALARAKEALIAWSVASDPPGRLPCPEDPAAIGTANEGQALGSCSNSLPSVGRLPWRTLKIEELRDANGDHLWYALSAGFRNPPINSDTLAQLAVDGAPNNAVAIIFSPGPPIGDQLRSVVGPGTPPDRRQYLDLSNNDGDAAFVTSGPADTFNDRVLNVTHSDLFRSVELRVAREVSKELAAYYDANKFLPKPASFNDSTCLGTASNPSSCLSSSANRGRVPANPNIPWDSLSILRGTTGSTPDWFQRNGWRELVFYAVSSRCWDGTFNCSGGGSLLDIDGRPAKVVAIVAGRTVGSEDRASPTLKLYEANYLEDENRAPLDDVFLSRLPTGSNAVFNDIVTSVQ